MASEFNDEQKRLIAQAAAGLNCEAEKLDRLIREGMERLVPAFDKLSERMNEVALSARGFQISSNIFTSRSRRSRSGRLS